MAEVLINLDHLKAFDGVDHQYLETVLVEAGFDPVSEDESLRCIAGIC